ncbi:MAG TPA: Gfo/Idh/MocA family oxidoreductase [Acetobacteraceae bacterium]|jgi:predicted dehydrogenase|nr:Gfo/Idh/MocA family oxidoreductase [Acetobacteraceae bacterium]
MSTLRVIVVGAGILGSRHARVFQEQGAEIVAVVDPNAERARAVAERTGARHFASLDDAWAGTDCDAVAVATPDHLHREPAVAVLARGKHVLVEKPLATTLEDMEAIAAAAANSSAIAMVNYSQRHVPEYAEIKRLVAGGAIGTPRMLSTHKFDRIYVPTRMIGWGDRTSPIYFMSSHDLDLVYWYLGADPVEVVAQETSGVLQARGVAVHDGVNALVRFADGAIGNIHTSWIHPDSYPLMADGFLQIIGSDGMMMLDNGRRRLSLYRASGSSEQAFAGPHTADEIDGRITGAFAASVRAFMDCIATGREPDTSPRRSLPISRLQAAVIRSLHERQTVRI